MVDSLSQPVVSKSATVIDIMLDVSKATVISYSIIIFLVMQKSFGLSRSWYIYLNGHSNFRTTMVRS